MEYFKTRVDDKSIKVGGKERVKTLEGYALMIIFKDGQAYIETLGRPNDQELETYPHVFFTSPDTWEHSLLDHEFSPEDELTWSHLQDTMSFYNLLFDAPGDLNQQIIATPNKFLDLPDHGSSETQLWLGTHPFHSEHLQGHHQVQPCCFNPRLSQEAVQSQKSCLQHP